MRDFAKKASRDGEKYEELVLTFEQEMALAVRYDPNNQKYRIKPNGQFTKESRHRWKNMSVKCHRHLATCEKALDKLLRITKIYPIYAAAAQQTGTTKQKIQIIRKTIKREAQRKGI
jgi:hypothetical protein